MQIGNALVLAVTTAVITAGSHGGTSAGAQLDGYRPGLLLVTGVALVGLLVTATGALLDRRRAGTRHSVPDYDYGRLGADAALPEQVRSTEQV